MPLGKYYCDYCDKEFQDTLYARKRHLQGLQHQRARSLWYNSFKDTNQTLPFEGVCNRFVRTGFCPYSDSCKYLHLSPTQPPPQPPLTPVSSFVPLCSPQVYTGVASFQGAAVGGIPWDNLPPSLKPPPEGGYPPLPFIDWG